MQALDEHQLARVTGGQDVGPQPRLDIPWPNVGRGRQPEAPQQQPQQPAPQPPSAPKPPWLPIPPLGPLF